MITKDTKISKIIEINDKAIDAIASVNRNFKKLNNPILRKLFASRVSIKDAAKIGGTSINELLRRLESIGCSVEYIEDENVENKESKKIIMDKENLITLDVRPILEQGVDPFEAIDDSLKTMTKNETLLIINSFEPVPLINKMKKAGYLCEVERIDDKTIYTYLSKTDEVHTEKNENLNSKAEISFEELKEKFKENLIEKDVRDLEMPMPMVTILETIEELKSGEALFVHHKRLPQYLLPELETRGWSYSKKEIDENNMKFIIYKK